MGSFRIAQIADLARQLLFTPTQTRSRQILAAEDLLLQLDPDKAYPFDFVLFRITGYHPKPTAEHLADAQSTGGFTGHLLTGLALQHDLGLLIEQVSESLGQLFEAMPQPVFSIEDVCAKYKVSDKSLQRWRRRGLAGRKFIFPDGRCRLGFLAASVERFFAAHRDQAERAADFSSVSDADQSRIFAMARRLAANGCCIDEIAQRAGRKFNRSPLTICHICRTAEDGASPLANAPAPLSERQCNAISRVHGKTRSLAAIAKRLKRPRSAIYRALVAARWEKLNQTRVNFFDDPLYHESEAAAAIDSIAAAQELAAAPCARDERIPSNLPGSLRNVYRQPLLTAARERALFLKLNFHKFQFSSLRRSMQAGAGHRRDLDQLESHLQLARETRKQIMAANLRLVVSIARRHIPPGTTLAGIAQAIGELVSDGNLTLANSIEAFDIHRGARFSSYATLSLMKGFAQNSYNSSGRKFSGRASSTRPAPGRFSRETQDEVDPIDERGLGEINRRADREEVQRLLSRLSDSERAVLDAHYGLSDRGDGVPIAELAREMKISDQRVRLIESNAIAKLRKAAEEEGYAQS